VYHRVQVGAFFGACPGVYLRTNSQCTWERLESLVGRISQAGWECTIECNQEGTSERT